MRQTLLVIILVSIMVGILYVLSIIVYPRIGVHEIIQPVITSMSQDHSLDTYSIENLRLRMVPESTLVFTETTKETSQYVSQLFYYYADGKKITGLSHIPKKVENAPVVIMFRGYADTEVYEPGYGTAHAGEYYATNGFVVLAPDFLGYGGSDMPSKNPVQERFERYTAGLTLIDSIKTLNASLSKLPYQSTADINHIGLWGHSNGGHVALVMLEITGKEFPTSLWNPVSKPFPYSILYYTDDFDDHGKALRKLVADFEKDYDAEKYSLTNYLEWINGPIILHQGESDKDVPKDWSDELYTSLEDLDKDVDYYTYRGNAHNFSEGAWNTVVARDVRFFKEAFKD